MTGYEFVINLGPDMGSIALKYEDEGKEYTLLVEDGFEGVSVGINQEVAFLLASALSNVKNDPSQEDE